MSSWSFRRWLEPAAVIASAPGSSAYSGIGRQLPPLPLLATGAVFLRPGFFERFTTRSRQELDLGVSRGLYLSLSEGVGECLCQ